MFKKVITDKQTKYKDYCKDKRIPLSQRDPRKRPMYMDLGNGYGKIIEKGM